MATIYVPGFPMMPVTVVKRPYIKTLFQVYAYAANAMKFSPATCPSATSNYQRVRDNVLVEIQKRTITAELGLKDEGTALIPGFVNQLAAADAACDRESPGPLQPDPDPPGPKIPSPEKAGLGSGWLWLIGGGLVLYLWAKKKR